MFDEGSLRAIRRRRVRDPQRERADGLEDVEPLAVAGEERLLDERLAVAPRADGVGGEDLRREGVIEAAGGQRGADQCAPIPRREEVP